MQSNPLVFVGALIAAACVLVARLRKRARRRA
jgi:hypothetical protein